MNQNKDKKSSIAAIILAAGASRRMGQPKQLLPYKRQTLLCHVIRSALASECKPVIVVLGANAEQIKPTINKFPIKIVKNKNWTQGISSSINCGVTYIQEQYLDIDAVVFFTCDQPFISAELIKQLVDAYNLSKKPIVASQYGDTWGIPALFSRNFFSALIKLKGDRGAKKIINQYRDLVYVIDFPQGNIDLDTLENYQQFINYSTTHYGI